MGSVLTKTVRKRIHSNEKKKLLFLGLDGVGKTTILYKLKLDELIVTIPTIGFNVEKLRHRNRDFEVWDIGAHVKIRPLYRHYYPTTDAIVFVIDSDDTDRFYHTKDGDSVYDELWRIINETKPFKTKLLVLANKQDLPNAISPYEIAIRLDLDNLTDREWYVQAAAAKAGYGLEEGMDWLWGQFHGRKAKAK